MAEDCESYTRRGDAAWLYDDNVIDADWAESADGASIATRDALEATIGRAFHRRVLREIAHVSQNYRALSLILTENKIAIPCSTPNGFAMSIRAERGRYVVHLGEWSDEFALVSEAVELLEAALRGEIRIRIDIGFYDRCIAAEKRLPSGEWIKLPRHEDPMEGARFVGPVRTAFKRNVFAPSTCYTQRPFKNMSGGH